MRDVVIVEAVRTPIGKRNGGLSAVHPAELLAAVQLAVVDRSGIDPVQIQQVVGGCVSQFGPQGMNITRTAWLTAGLPMETASSTLDAQCGSSQHATNVAYSMIKAGVVDVALACGVEVMSQVPIMAGTPPTATSPLPPTYPLEWTTQFQGAELIAQKWGITRDTLDTFGVESQRRAATAWNEERFQTQTAPVLGVNKDEGLRATSMESVANLQPVLPAGDPMLGGEPGRHTAATASQISDGAAAVLLMTSDKAAELELTPLARIVDACLVGSDPLLMLTGPIAASHQILARNGLSQSDIDIVEINEAFAAVVLAWQLELDPDPATVNPNGGAIALGHPLGATGAILVTKAVHELQRTRGEYAFVTMCCGGGLGTGTLLRRL
jgi:acetyl-CoA C-acetyltransferase